MSSPANLPNTPIIIDEKANPYRDCIQGLANQPITVVRLLRDAVNENPVVGRDRGFVVPEIKDVVGRLVENRPRIAIIGGAPDHPAHLLDRPQALMAAIRIWEMGVSPSCFMSRSFVMVRRKTISDKVIHWRRATTLRRQSISPLKVTAIMRPM